VARPVHAAPARQLAQAPHLWIDCSTPGFPMAKGKRAGRPRAVGCPRTSRQLRLLAESGDYRTCI